MFHQICTEDLLSRKKSFESSVFYFHNTYKKFLLQASTAWEMVGGVNPLPTKALNYLLIAIVIVKSIRMCCIEGIYLPTQSSTIPSKIEI
jgi:hypothetical protein